MEKLPITPGEISSISGEKSSKEVKLFSEQQIREYADRAQYADFIGRVWEDIGQEVLKKSLSKEQMWVDEKEKSAHPIKILFLDTDPKIKKAVRGLRIVGKEGEERGVKVPDILIFEKTEHGDVRIRPGDFKFELITASPSQIFRRTFIELWNNSPEVQDVVSGVIRSGEMNVGVPLEEKLKSLQKPGTPLSKELDIPLDPDGKVVVGPGFFFSPATEENLTFLEDDKNKYTDRKTGFPTEELRIPPENVKFCGFEAPEIGGLIGFLRKGPGWEIAKFLASFDQVNEEELKRYESVIYYARIGVGVEVTWHEIQAPLFGQPGEFETSQIIAGVENYCKEKDIKTSYDLIESLEIPRLEKQKLLARKTKIVGSVFERKGWGGKIRGKTQRSLFSREDGYLGYQFIKTNEGHYVGFDDERRVLLDLLFEVLEGKYQTLVLEKVKQLRTEELERKGWTRGTLPVDVVLKLDKAVLDRFEEKVSEGKTLAQTIKESFEVESLSPENLKNLLLELAEA